MWRREGLILGYCFGELDERTMGRLWWEWRVRLTPPSDHWSKSEWFRWTGTAKPCGLRFRIRGWGSLGRIGRGGYYYIHP